MMDALAEPTDALVFLVLVRMLDKSPPSEFTALLTSKDPLAAMFVEVTKMPEDMDPRV